MSIALFKRFLPYFAPRVSIVFWYGTDAQSDPHNSYQPRFRALRQLCQLHRGLFETAPALAAHLPFSSWLPGLQDLLMSTGMDERFGDNVLQKAPHLRLFVRTTSLTRRSFVPSSIFASLFRHTTGLRRMTFMRMEQSGELTGTSCRPRGRRGISVVSATSWAIARLIPPTFGFAPQRRPRVRFVLGGVCRRADVIGKSRACDLPMVLLYMSRSVIVSARTWFRFSTLALQTLSAKAMGSFASSIGLNLYRVLVHKRPSAIEDLLSFWRASSYFLCILRGSRTLLASVHPLCSDSGVGV